MFVVKFLFPLLVAVCSTFGAIEKESKVELKKLAQENDLTTSATSAKLFNLGSLFGQTPNYGYGGPNYGYRPNIYPSSGVGFWTSSNYPNYGVSGYNPTTTGGYYPTTATTSGYYPTTGGSGYFPQSGSYYPGTGSGTNILGGNNLGYGGYGGNGGLRQYSGYWNPGYTGTRNRGYGYYADTDRNGH